MNDNICSGFQDVIDQVNSTCLDETASESHQGSLERYNELLSKIVADVLAVSVTQIADGTSPLNSSRLVASTFSKVAKVIGVAFGRPFDNVAIDIVAALENFPSDDYRTAILLRKENKLH